MLVHKDLSNTPRWREGERLHHLFEQRCDELHDHLAVVTQDVTLTYRELDNRANQLARYLIERGIRRARRQILDEYIRFTQ